LIELRRALLQALKANRGIRVIYEWGINSTRRSNGEGGKNIALRAKGQRVTYRAEERNV
jgi:hypothetical protein